jgi:membrane protein YdbS with pleckstrin-like domain
MQPNDPQNPQQYPQNPVPNQQPAPQMQPNPQPMGGLDPHAVKNPLNVMSPGEQIICDIKRHPIGLLGVYLISGFLILVLLGGVALLPQFVSDLSNQTKLYAFVGALLLAAIITLFSYVAIVVYKGNRWIVTSDSITQVTQTGLFQKQTSQLSLGNLEDVTFEQNSLIQSMFGFGTLKVETAGERSKFQFPYCPSPQKCAVEIIQAHEQFMAENPEGGNTHLNTSGPSINTQL